MTDIDQRAFRDAMGQFCTGVVVVTSMDAGSPVGFAAQSFVSVSLDPPLIAICPGKASSSWPRIRGAGHFAINVLSADQRAICDGFARSGVDKFSGVSWTLSDSGSPILEGVICYVDCMLEAEHEAGDHTIAVGRVVDFSPAATPGSGLLFFRGGYGEFSGH